MQTGKVFFSYSRVDEKFALKLAEDLRAAGVNIWIDQTDIRPSEPWDEEIEKALDTSECLLVALSHTSVSSDNVLNEINFALETKKRVMPVIIDSNVKKPFNIRRLQHIDFTGSYDNGLRQLLKALHPANPSPASEQAADASGKWSTSDLVNPFQKSHTYRLHFDIEVMGNVLVGTVNMVSAAKDEHQGIKKGIMDGKVSNSNISFSTIEQSIVGSENVTYRNFYNGHLVNDEIRFSLHSDRPWGFPGQKFIARRSAQHNDDDQ